jgi:hypothetical protein
MSLSNIYFEAMRSLSNIYFEAMRNLDPPLISDYDEYSANLWGWV